MMFRRGERWCMAVGRMGVGLGVGLVVYLVLVGLAVALPSEREFRIEPGSFGIVPSTFQAGAHENLTTSFDFAHNAKGQPFNDVKNVVVKLPAGFIGNNTAVPACTDTQLLGFAGVGGRLSACSPASAVGRVSFDFAGERDTQPIYNMQTTSFGVTAELGFKFGRAVAVKLIVGVRPEDTGLTVTIPGIESLGETRENSATIWGIPASHEHDLERQQVCESGVCYNELDGPAPVDIPVKPYLANPTSCGSFATTMKADAWETPESWSEAATEVGPIGECERVPFRASIEVQPTTVSTESPSGLNVSLVVPQSWEDPFSTSTANVKDTVLALPIGYTVNPSAGSGLGVCTPEELGQETSSSPPGAGCPEESKIGFVEVETPVLAEKLLGSIYVAKPFDNPFGSLLALYIVVKSPVRGIVVKLAGRIEPDPVTGQLVTMFNENPQVPFSRFTLKLRQGATSPLVSPPVCGIYTAEGELTPWSAPASPQQVNSSFVIERGIGGGPCPPGGVPPFAPGLLAGTLNNRAGSYSSMGIRVTRKDGEQEITRFSAQLPPGLTAKLAGVPFCPDASIQAAKHNSGAQEEAGPSCPAASEIGHSLVGAGVGTVLAYTPGKIYMAGPYNGAPFSIVAITSAKVGPFDLGTVVVRVALKIDPQTAAVTADGTASDAIPHIIDGIVVHVRDIRVYVDRPQFTLNPTNCNPMSFTATIDGSGADFTNPADQVPVTVTNPFQLADCQSLAFKPNFKVSTTGKTSRSKGASLTAKLLYPNAAQGTQANIAKVKVDLPKQLPSRLTTLQKACPDNTFNANPATCPPASIIGSARANTPILPVPLVGPAYFVSHGGAKFPELIIVLQGYGVTLDLHGETFISKQGITSSTFRAIPDAPVGSFELTLPQGPHSALAANGNLCKNKLKMPTIFTAQNGTTIHQTTPINITNCPKHKTHKTNNHKHNNKKK
jgi:hypothetical protein